jgi:cation:H+ antiporter
VVTAVSRLAYGLKMSAFTVSFFVLGLLTSLPEISIGFTAIATDDPSIFVGNLIGGIFVLFLLVIPLLALTEKGVTVPKQLNKTVLAGLLVVCFLPTFLVRDSRITTYESIIAIIAYCLLFIFFSKEQGLFEKVKNKLSTKRKIKWWDAVKIVVGVCLLIVGSNQIVESTEYFAQVLEISPFFVSLIIVSLGTNIPEITILFRSIAEKKTDVALADYLGSATANTLLFGVLSLTYNQTIILPSTYIHRYLLMIISLLLFYLFMRTKNRISRKEGMMLLLLYTVFIVIELFLL